MKKRTAVLIPAYNPRREEFAQTLRSVLDQPVPVDVCVIDDGSAQPVTSPFPGDPRIGIIRLPKNGGITKALRVGVEHCINSGYEFICRLDVGDISHQERVSRQLNYMVGNPQVDALGAISRVTDLNGNELFHHGVAGGPQSVRKYLWKNSPFKHSTFFLRVSSLRKYGSYDESFNGAEDYELLLRLSSLGVVDCLDQVLIDYVEDPNGISNKKRGLQLRMRLRAQLAHANPLAIGWYLGVLRTVVTRLTPRGLARRATLLIWSAKR